MRGFIIWFLFMLAIAFGIRYAEAAPAKYDGTWTVSISNNCQKEKHDVVVIIKDSNLFSDQILLDIQGAIRDNGEVNIIVSHNGHTFYSVGHFSEKAGAGVWQTDNCSGAWKATKR